MRKIYAPARAWYGGRESPDDSLLDLVEASAIQQLYSHQDGQVSGDRVEQVRALREKLCNMHRIAEWTFEKGLGVLLMVVMDCALSLRERAIALESLGRYAFDPDATSAEKKDLLQTVFMPSAATLDQQIQQLAEIWTPEPNSLLDLILNRPAKMGQILADRLEPEESLSLKIVGFTLDEVDPEVRKVILQSQLAAYERDGVIYMLLPLLDALKGWDLPLAEQVEFQLTLWEMLFVHELTEMVLEETLELEPLPAHIVASTLERLLDDTLGMAVESYFLELQRRTAEVENDSVDAIADLGAEELFAEAAHAPTGIDEFFAADDGGVASFDSNKQEQNDLVNWLNDDAAAEPFAAETAQPAPPERADGVKTVVIVDDTAMIRQLVGNAVEKLGHEFMEAVDGKEGLELIRTVRPDLVVLDLNMGKMGGLDTLRSLRGDPEFKTTPIIVLTVETRQRIIREVLTWKIDDYLIKPVNMKKLQARMAVYLNI